jgi:hypothetical protein
MATGIVMTSVALPFALFGALASEQAYDSCTDRAYENTNGGVELAVRGNDCRDSRTTRNYAIGLVTVAMIAVGIPLIVYGAKRVPNEPQAMVTPWASPTAAGATFRLSL